MDKFIYIEGINLVNPEYVFEFVKAELKKSNATPNELYEAVLNNYEGDASISVIQQYVDEALENL